MAHTSGARSGGSGSVDRVRSGAPRKLGLEGRMGVDEAVVQRPGSKGNTVTTITTGARTWVSDHTLQDSVPTSPHPTSFSLLGFLALAISCTHTECIRTAVQMDLGQAASEVTSTLMVGVHPKLSSKCLQYHTAQELATIQPTAGNPDRGQYLPEDTQQINSTQDSKHPPPTHSPACRSGERSAGEVIHPITLCRACSKVAIQRRE